MIVEQRFLCRGGGREGDQGEAGERDWFHA
jgi:hypothetical protein